MQIAVGIILVLVLSLGGLGALYKNSIAKTATATALAQGWERSAGLLADRVKEEAALKEAVDKLQLARTRERNLAWQVMGKYEKQIEALKRDNPKVQEYGAIPMPVELDIVLLDIERAAGAHPERAAPVAPGGVAAGEPRPIPK